MWQMSRELFPRYLPGNLISTPAPVASHLLARELLRRCFELTRAEDADK